MPSTSYPNFDTRGNPRSKGFLSRDSLYLKVLSESELKHSLQTLLSRRPPSSKAHISLFGAFDPSLRGQHAGTLTAKPQPIHDPYYGGPKGFDKCYEQCMRFSSGFLDMLEQEGEAGGVERTVSEEQLHRADEAIGL